MISPRVGARTWASGGLVVAGFGVAGLCLDGSVLAATLRVVAVGAVVGGAAVVLRRGRTVAASATAIAAGIVATAIGLAVAIPWSRTVGLVPRTAAGWLATLGGLAALVAGTVLALRATRRWRRLGVVLAVPAAAYLIGFPVVIAVAATNVPRKEVDVGSATRHHLVVREVRFHASDGVELTGWYVPSRNRAAVVVAHGASSTRSDVVGQAAVLVRHGYGVLLVDARGTGTSGGRAMNLGWYGTDDLTGAVDYLAGRPDVDVDRIGVLGESMGGEEAIGAMGADARIRGVVAEGATGRVAADHAWLSDEYGLRGWIQRGLDAATYGLADLLTDADPPPTLRSSVAAAAPRPVLLIAAGAVPDEAIAARDLQAVAPRSVEVWVVPGAGHTGGLAQAPRRWEERVVEFFDHALLHRR